MATPHGAFDIAAQTPIRPLPSARATPRPAPSAPARPLGRTGERRLRRWLILNGWRLLLTAFLLGAWEIAATTVTTPFWVSQPTRVFVRLVDLTANGLLFWHVAATLQSALLGLLLGASAGVVLGLLLGARPGVAAAIDPLLMGLNSLPRVALAPLFIIWFGIGLPSKVVLAFSLVVFPVLINTYQGVRGVDRELVDMLRTMQASPAQIARRVTLPSTLPWIFAGLRIGLGMSLIGAVVGELVGSSRGVGYYVEAAAANFDTTGVFAGLVILMILTIALNEAMKLAESRVFRWKQADMR
ncbi:MAG: ABC transporter permease subunit [Chloroflexi bacterium]|nr:ABC transporter permease subunit [Chloroflexota bacterium]